MKFTLDEDKKITTPIQAELLKVVEIKNELVFYFLVKENTLNKTMKERHTFMLEPTDVPFKHGGRCDFVETFVLDNEAFVMHLFKLRDVEFVS